MHTCFYHPLDGVVEGRKLKRFVKRVVVLGPVVHDLQNIPWVIWELFKGLRLGYLMFSI
jgi:hypothetical protein